MIKTRFSWFKKLFIIPFLLFSMISFSQNFKKEKRIYMLDITKSMWGTGGGENIFAELSELAPAVSVESVIDRNPEVLLAAGDSGDRPFLDWRRWDTLAANRLGNHFVVRAAEIGRATPRLVSAALQVCESLERARVSRRNLS